MQLQCKHYSHYGNYLFPQKYEVDERIYCQTYTSDMILTNISVEQKFSIQLK